MYYFIVDGVSVANRFFELEEAKLSKQFIGGDRLATFSLSAPTSDARHLFIYFNNWLGRDIRFDRNLWNGFIAEMEINYGSFRYRKSLLDGYATRVQVEYDPGGGTPLTTSWYVNEFAEERFGRKDFYRVAHYLTSSDAAVFAQRLLDEMSHPVGKYVGMSSQDDVITLDVTAIGYFFKIDWQEFDPYGTGLGTYPVNADAAVEAVLTNQLSGIDLNIESNSQSVVGPPNETDPLDYIKQISTHTDSFSYYRVWYDPRNKHITASFVDPSLATPVANGRIGIEYTMVQPGFFKDTSTPNYSDTTAALDVQNLIFADTVNYNIKDDQLTVSIGSAETLGIEDLYDLHVALRLDNFIVN